MSAFHFVNTLQCTLRMRANSVCG